VFVSAFVLIVFHTIYFVSNPKFWYFNSDTGSILIYGAKMLGKNSAKLVGVTLGAGVGFDQTYASMTNFHPSHEYGRYLRGEQSFEEFKKGGIHSFESTFGKFKK